MEGEVLSEDELLMKLRDSRCRFQRRMQQLIEKYNQPFEDGPVIQMSTLTYQTPQEGKDTHVTLAPSLASPARPAQGYCKDISEDRPGGPLQPPPSPREGDASHSCSAGQAMMPRGDGIPLHGTGGGSFSSSPCSKGEDVCNATLSDLYAGMLHSMSRLLGARPSCIISTKTLIGQNWSFRRRHRCKGRMNRTSCRGGGRSRQSPQERRPPCSEPLEDAGTLRDRGNLPDVSVPKTDLKSGRALLKVNKPQIHTFTPPWKELQGMPQKHSSLTYLDSKVLSPLDQENRFVTLKWLISPVKIASRPRILRGQAGSRFKEIEIKFDKLHQEYCLSPGKQLSLTYPPGSAVDVYRGEAHRLSSPLCKSKAKRLSEASEGLGRRSIRVGSCLPESESFPSLSKTNPTCSAGRPEHTVDLVCLGSDLGKFQESVSFSKAISVPRVQPLGFARDRYDDIKEKFDKLHRQYCQKSPQQTQAPSDKARAGVRYQKEGFSVKFNPDSGCRGPPSLSSSPQQSVKSPLASNTVGAPPSMDVALAAGSGHQVPTKRCRLSDPQVAMSQFFTSGGQSWSFNFSISPPMNI
uniref:Holliday junction recognition protein n=1 Tax=Bos indicus x Bos taurus TaxID=30522 RepID=A0A4W2D8Z5_BOBOX